MKLVDLDEYVTSTEAAEALGLQYPTLMARIDKGKVETLRVGRFHLIHKTEVKRIKNDS